MGPGRAKMRSAFSFLLDPLGLRVPLRPRIPACLPMLLVSRLLAPSPFRVMLLVFPRVDSDSVLALAVRGRFSLVLFLPLLLLIFHQLGHQRLVRLHHLVLCQEGGSVGL